MSGIGAIGGAPLPIGPLTGPARTAGPGAAGGASFTEVLGRGLEHTQQVQQRADDLAVKAATGELSDVHEYLAASTEASLTTQLTVAVRNKAIEAFNEIMRLQA